MADLHDIYTRAITNGLLDSDVSEARFKQMLKDDNERKAYFNYAQEHAPGFYSSDFEKFSRNAASLFENTTQTATVTPKANEYGIIQLTDEEANNPTGDNPNWRDRQRQQRVTHPDDWDKNLKSPSVEIPTLINDATRKDQTRQKDLVQRVPEDVMEHNQMVMRRMEERRPENERMWAEDKPMIDEIYQQAEQDAKAEFIHAAEEYSKIPIGANGDEISRGMSIIRRANEKRDPQKLIDAFNKRLDERMIERFGDAYSPQAALKSDEEVAFELGKTPEDYQLYKQYVTEQLQQYFTDVNMPKNQLEYFARKVIQANLLGQLYEAGTKPLSQRQYEMKGIGQYAEQNDTGGLDVAAEITNVALDLPLMAITGGVGGVAERGASKIATRGLVRALDRRGIVEAEQMAARMMAQNAWYRAGMGAIKEGTTFATLNTLNAMGTDLLQEGKLTPRVANAALEGFATGAVLGVAHVPNNKLTSYLQDQYGRKTGTLLGAANSLNVRTNIMVGGQALGHTLNGESLDNFDWGEAYLHAGLMNMGFDLLGAGKMYINNRLANDVTTIKQAITRTINQMTADPNGYLLSKEDIAQLNRAGVEGKDVRELVDNILRTEGAQNPTRTDVDKYLHNNDPQVREIQSRLESIFTNPEIDTEVKAKLYQIFTGKSLPAYAINTDNVVKQEDGKYIVRTYDNTGMTYNTRIFDNLDDAESYRKRQVAETRPQLLQWSENIGATAFRAQAQREMTDRVVKQMSEELGVSEGEIRQGLKSAVDKTMQGREQTEQETQLATRYAELMEDAERSIFSGMVINADLADAYREVLNGDKGKGFRSVFAKQYAKKHGVPEDRIMKMLDSKYSSLSESDRKIYDDYVGQLQMRIRPNANVTTAEWAENWSEWRDPVASLTESAPIGHNQWGDVYQWKQGRHREAAHFLQENQSGYLRGVFNRPEIGDIDLVWGTPQAGLQHIIDKHIIKQNDFANVDEAMETISKTIKDGEMQQQGNRYVVDNNGNRVVITKSEDGNWVITAYDNSRTSEEKRRTGAAEKLLGQQGNTGNTSSPLYNDTNSADKGTSNNSISQERLDEIRTDIQNELDKHVFGNAPFEDAEIITVTDQASPDRRGYIVQSNSGTTPTTISANGKTIFDDDEMVYVRWDDGRVLPAMLKDLDFVSRENATHVAESMVTERMLSEQGKQTFASGQTVWYTDPKTGQTFDSRVVSVTDEGVEIEIEDDKGNPNTLSVPHGVALTQIMTENSNAEPISPESSGAEPVSVEPAIVSPEQSAEPQSTANQPAEATPQALVPEPPQRIEPNAQTMTSDELAARTIEYLDGDRQTAKAYLEAELNKAKRAASALNKRKVERFNGIADFKLQNDQLNEQKKSANALVSKLESAIVAANSYKTESEKQASDVEKSRQSELRAQRRKTEEGKTDSTPAERWNNQTKLEGNSVTRTLPDGTKIKGRYVLAEAGAATPSHDPFNGWNTSDGFPVTEDGRNINDRDYLNDKDAQQITMQIAQTYDGQAVEQVPVVSSEGIVYDGNGRTIAGHIAAANNTDAAYLEALRENAANFGFTEEQLQQYQHPRVYMQVDEDLPYNTTTFKKFNAQEKKTTSSTNRAVANSKAINDAVRDNLLQIMDNYGTLDAFFGSEQGSSDMVGMLVSEGVITQQEVAGLTEPTDKGYLLSNAGKDYITDIMLGALFDESTIRMLGTDKALKRAILRALPQIVENRRLGEYSLSDNINGAIRLLYEARKADMTYWQYVRQVDAFYGMVADRYSPFEMLLSEEMQTGVEQFRQVLELYNKSARDEANGQGALFEPLTPEAIKQEIINRYGKQQATKPTTAVSASQERPALQETEPPVPSAQTGNGGQIDENTQHPLQNSENNTIFAETNKKTDNNEDGRRTTTAQSGISGLDRLQQGELAGRNTTPLQDARGVGEILKGKVASEQHRIARQWAKDTGLLFDIFKLSKQEGWFPFKSGNESDNWVDTKQSVVVKMNNLMHSVGKIDTLLERVELYNQLFPDTPLRLLGFSDNGFEDRVYPVFVQRFIPEGQTATVGQIDEYMRGRGFEPTGSTDGEYTNGDVVVSDVRPRNVLVAPNGGIYVIDADVKRVEKATTDRTPLDVVKAAIDKQKQQAEHRKQVQEYINQIAGGKYETVLWNTDDYRNVLTTELKKKGYSEDAISGAIQSVKNKLASLSGTDSMNGFFIGQQLFLNDASDSLESFRSAYVHERQHGMTQEHPEWIHEVMHQMSREELSQVVANLCNSTAYNNESHDVLADEYISMAMEKAYGVENDEELEQILQHAGSNNSLINFIKQLNDEQRKESSLSRARRNANVNNHKQGSSGQNGRNPWTLPRGNLDEQGLRPSQQGTRGTESRGQGVEEPANSEKEQSGDDARFSIAQRDKEYKDAVEHGDTEKVQQMLQEEAERKGYKSVQDYKDAHHAPCASVEKSDFTNLDVLRDVVEENGEDSNLFAVAQGISVQPDDYFSPMGARWYGYDDAEGMESYHNIRKAIDAIQEQLYEYGEVKDMPVIEVYRAVPKDIRGKQLESEGQWVSPSKKYAINHGRSRFGFNEYRIVKQEVPVDQLWWDGNDIREWGFDDGTQNVYKNTTNNRKLSDVTYDENGELIPLSQRFNEKKSDVRFSVSDDLRNSVPSSVQREMDDIKAKAQADGTFMKAPNREPSNLTERQWLQVRTKNFKRWFGDWELSNLRDYLLGNDVVAKLNGNEFEKDGIPLTEKVSEFYDKEYKGRVVRKDFGEVMLDRRSIKDSLSHGIGRLKSAAFAAVPNIIKSGRIIDSQSEWKGRNYDSFTFAAPIQIGNDNYVGVVVVTRGKGTDKNRFYLHEVILQENLQNERFKTDTKADTHSGDIAKVLQNIVTAKSSSKVVDENGEPLVVYHYTDYKFNVFGKEKQVGINTFSNASNALYASTTTIGDWFTTNRHQKYLHNPMELFLNIQNPYDGYSLSTLAHEIGEGISEEDAYEFEEDRENIRPIIDAGERFVRTLQSDGYDGVVINDEEFNGVSYVTFSPNQIKSATDNTGAFDKKNDDIRFSIIGEQPLQENETKLDYVQRVAKGRNTKSESEDISTEELSDSDIRFSIRNGEPPKKTGIGYKVFYHGKDGNLYPPMVANPNGADTPVGVWLDADAAPVVGQSKTGRPQVKAGGKGTKGGSGQLAYRPGWHLGEIPYALQFNRKDSNGNKTLFPKDFVWAEVEYADDINYQQEAESYGITENGKYRHSYAGLPRIPQNGSYRYRTNPNPETDSWIITGAMKVNRILTNEEVDDIVRRAGRKPQRREGEEPRFSISGSKVRFDFHDAASASEIQDLMEEQEEYISGAIRLILKLESYFGGELYSGSNGAREALKRGLLPVPSKPNDGLNYEYHHLRFINEEGEDFVVSVPFDTADRVRTDFEPHFSVSNNNPPTSRRQSLVREMLRNADELNEQLKTATLRNADGRNTDGIKYLQADYANFMQAALKLMHKDIEGMRQLQGAQRLQKAYDKGTINALASYAQMFLQSGWAEDATKTELSRLLGSIRNGTTESDITSAVEKMFNLFTNTQLRQTKNIFKSLLKTPLQKINISGVREQGKVDLRTQYAMREIKSAIQESTPDAIENRIAELQDKLESTQDDALRVQYEAQIDGLQIAESYNNTVRTLEEEAKNLKEELADAKADKSVTGKAKKELIASVERAMLDNEQDLIVAYQKMNGLVSDILKNGKLRAKSFIEEQKSRQSEIRHFANSDLQGISPAEHVTTTRQQRIDNCVLVSGGIFSPLGSLNSILKRLAPNALGGKGYLYNHFIYGVVEASSNEAVGLKQAFKELDEKVSEIWGKEGMTFAKAERATRKMPKIKAQVTDFGVDENGKSVRQTKDIELTQGQAAYIYMVNKMVDGEMKLRKMGISEEDIEALTAQLDPRLIELCNWIQNEFLTTKRNKYNAVHERMFGAPMASIENYFPLRIMQTSRNSKEDVADNNSGKGQTTGTTTGAIKQRVRNSLPLDVLHSDIFSVMIDHLQEMEHWAAFAQITRDANQLLSYNTFKRRLNNMSTVYGAGNKLYQNLKKAFQLALGTYEPMRDKASAFTAQAAKGLSTSAISLRISTAIKQFLSHPAYWTEFTDPRFMAEYAKNLIMTRSAVKWALKNLPLLEKRWNSRAAGDTRILDNEDDWRYWHNHVVEWATRIGMSPNGFVDMITCAQGAKAYYELKVSEYEKNGMSREDADKRAKLDAEIFYNETQQSSEGAFIAPIQKDRSWQAITLSLFNNSNFAYQRRAVEHLQQLKQQIMHKDNIMKMQTKLYERMYNMSEEEAKQKASKDFKHNVARNIIGIVIFGYIIQQMWRIGGNWLYMIAGGDREEKKKIFEDASLGGGLSTPVRGLIGGRELETLLDAIRNDGSLAQNSSTPAGQAIGNILKDVQYEQWGQMLNDIVDTAVGMGTGILPSTIVNMALGVYDAVHAHTDDDTNNDLKTAREIILAAGRVCSVPQSQLDKIYIDEFGCTGEELKNTFSSGNDKRINALVERYIDYHNKRRLPLTGGHTFNEEQDDKLYDRNEKRFDRAMDARYNLHFKDE